MKTTVSVIKADIGSVSGHCVAHPELLDICDSVLNDALDTGILKDYYIRSEERRVGKECRL